MNGISVIVCCYNSAERIGTTLNFLKKQRVEHLSWEVILVDNNCTDETVNEAISVWGNYPVKLLVIKEEKAGLIHARNTGVMSAKYDFLIFCDDDNWLEENYLKFVNQLFNTNPHVGAIGGKSTMVTESEGTIPNWFKTEENAYAVGKQAFESGDVTSRLYLWGAGLAIRKNLAEQCFDTEFPFLLMGRNGKQITAGDDFEICSRIILIGYSLLYDERLQYEHYIPSVRLTEIYLAQMKMGFENSYGILILYSEIIRALILDKRSKTSRLLDIMKERPFNKRKFLRMLFWLYGLHLYVNDDMQIIREFYKKHNNL